MNIDKKAHTSNLVGSLNRFFINAKNKGMIRNKELYLLDTIYTLVNDCSHLITQSDKDKLVRTYYNLLFKFSNILCRSSVIDRTTVVFRNPKVKTSFTHTPDDSISTPDTSKIYYWQEENIYRDYADIYFDILNTNYLLDKPSDTLSVFNLGKDIDYNSVGVIAFAITDVDMSSEFKIYDILDNEVTHAFTETTIEDDKTILFTSNFLYAYGLMNIKIKKT